MSCASSPANQTDELAPTLFKATGEAIKKAQETGKQEDIVAAMKSIDAARKLAVSDAPYGFDLGVAVRQLGAANGYTPDDADKSEYDFLPSSIHSKYWEKIRGEEGEDSEIGKAITKAKRTNKPDDISAAAKLIMNKYGPYTVTGVLAGELDRYAGSVNSSGWKKED